MAIVHLGDMLHHAERNGYAIGGIHVDSLESVSAVLLAAEECRAPVILNIAQSDAGRVDLETLTVAAEHAAARAKVPVGLHFDRGHNCDAVIAAIRWGCNSVALDAARQLLPENIARTHEVATLAHSCGITVEGMVGRVVAENQINATAQHHRADLISPEEAKAFAMRTQVDFVAVDAATGDEREHRKHKLDLQRIGRIKTAVDRPLIVHGGSSLSEEHLRRLSGVGVAKVNVNTSQSMFVKQSNAAPTTADIRNATQHFVTSQLRALGSAGRAAEVALRCRPWMPVEHVIIFNVGANVPVDIAAIMAHGRCVLSQIPGVRSVSTGTAVQERARYQFCWLVCFASRAVIDTYRDHPLHMKFADELFRPIASDRISIDFECVTQLDDGTVEAAGKVPYAALSELTRIRVGAENALSNQATALS